MNSFDSSQSLGNQGKWHMIRYLVRIGDFPAALSLLFWKEPKYRSNGPVTTAAVNEFVAALKLIEPTFTVEIDAPRFEGGEIFLDVTSTEYNSEVSFKPGVGFSLYISSASFGQKPDEIVTDPRKAAERFAAICYEAFETD